MLAQLSKMYFWQMGYITPKAGQLLESRGPIPDLGLGINVGARVGANVQKIERNKNFKTIKLLQFCFNIIYFVERSVLGIIAVTHLEVLIMIRSIKLLFPIHLKDRRKMLGRMPNRTAGTTTRRLTRIKIRQ